MSEVRLVGKVAITAGAAFGHKLPAPPGCCVRHGQKLVY